MAAQLGLEVLPLNEEGRRSVARLTFFFLFHCPPQLYNHLVHSNWAHLPLAPRQAEDISHGDDESGGGESLVEGLSRLQLRPPDHSDDCPSLVEAALPSPLRHVVVVGNSFTSILNQRSSASSNHRSEAPSKSARRSQLSSAAATLASLSTPLCPLHSTAPPPSDTPLPSTSPRASPDAPPSPSPPPPQSASCRTRGMYEALCVVDALRLLHVDDLSAAARESEVDLATAVHGSYVQWFDWPEKSEGDEQMRGTITRWLQRPLKQPLIDRDDAEIVLAEHTQAGWPAESSVGKGMNVSTAPSCPVDDV